MAQHAPNRPKAGQNRQGELGQRVLRAIITVLAYFAGWDLPPAAAPRANGVAPRMPGPPCTTSPGTEVLLELIQHKGN
ncbi:hypothetical protein B7463_g4272, partial [Scytalidium lignicola]